MEEESPVNQAEQPQPRIAVKPLLQRGAELYLKVHGMMSCHIIASEKKKKSSDAPTANTCISPCTNQNVDPNKPGT